MTRVVTQVRCQQKFLCLLTNFRQQKYTDGGEVDCYELHVSTTVNRLVVISIYEAGRYVPQLHGHLDEDGRQWPYDSEDIPGSLPSV